MLLHRLSLLIPASLQAQGKAGVIVDHPQRMTPLSVAQGKMPFEIHLPQLIGRFSFEALPGLVLARQAQIDSPMSSQNRMNRATGRNLALAYVLHPGPDLASAPRRILIPNRQYSCFDLRRRSLRPVPWAARPIPQPRLSCGSIPLQPFVPGLAADPKPLAQLFHVRFRLDRQLDKLSAQQHKRSFFPRHALRP
jgi:hypothetical protein